MSHLLCILRCDYIYCYHKKQLSTKDDEVEFPPNDIKSQNHQYYQNSKLINLVWQLLLLSWSKLLIERYTDRMTLDITRLNHLKSEIYGDMRHLMSTSWENVFWRWKFCHQLWNFSRNVVSDVNISHLLKRFWSQQNALARAVSKTF